jgi:hypothetical protein
VEQGESWLLSGEQVECVVFPGEAPEASQGEFRFENRSEVACELAIQEAWFAENEQRRRLSPFFVYADGVRIEGPMRVAARATIRFRVTFPCIRVSVAPAARHAVVVAGRCDGREVRALSILSFIFERPAP